MRNNKIFLFISILAVVAVSGCVSNLGFGGGETKVEAPNDVLSFSDSAVIPNPPILTGDTFTTSFQIKNLDDFEDAKNVKLQLYDWGVCEPTTTCSPTGGIYTRDIGAVSPKDVQQIECQFKSPSSEKIGGMNARCPIRYKLAYDFSGETTTDLNLISGKKFQDMQRAGQTPTFTSTQAKSRGPIKVDFSFGINQPVRTSSKDSIVKIPMYIRIENKGSGKLTEMSPSSTGSDTDATSTAQPFTVQISKNPAVLGDALTVSGSYVPSAKVTIFVDDAIVTSNVSTNSNGYYETSVKAGKTGSFKLKACSSDDTTKCSNILDFTIVSAPVAPSTETAAPFVALKITVPKELAENKDCTKLDCDGYFSGKTEGDNCVLALKSDKKVDFVKDKSQVFRCELTSPDESVVTDTKTYSIQSEVKYTYQIDNDFDIAIKPMTFG